MDSSTKIISSLAGAWLLMEQVAVFALLFIACTILWHVWSRK